MAAMMAVEMVEVGSTAKAMVVAVVVPMGAAGD